MAYNPQTNCFENRMIREVYTCERKLSSCFPESLMSVFEMSYNNVDYRPGSLISQGLRDYNKCIDFPDGICNKKKSLFDAKTENTPVVTFYKVNNWFHSYFVG